MTPQELRHYASEPRDYRVIESVLLEAAAEMERLQALLAQEPCPYCADRQYTGLPENACETAAREAAYSKEKIEKAER